MRGRRVALPARALLLGVPFLFVAPASLRRASRGRSTSCSRSRSDAPPPPSGDRRTLTRGESATGFWVPQGGSIVFTRSMPAGASLDLCTYAEAPSHLSIDGATVLPAGPAFARARDDRPGRRLRLEAREAAVFVASARIRATGLPASTPERLTMLISCDTLRADALGCYGAPVATPHLDRLSRRALVYEDAMSNAPWTLPSHMTLLTGLYPGEHRVTADRALAAGYQTLAERLSARGTDCAGFATKVGWLDGSFGFSRGFAPYILAWEDAGPAIDRALAWIDEPRTRPAFAFLHFYDAHSDTTPRIYDAGSPFARRAGNPELASRHPTEVGSNVLRAEDELLQTLSGGELERHRAEIAPLVAELALYYHEGVAALDLELGRLDREIAARGLTERTALVLTADHGEELLEHGRLLHSQLYDETLHVPLLLAGTGSRGLDASPVELRDVAAFLLEGEGRIATARERLAFERLAGRRVIHDGRHVLVYEIGKGPVALYDTLTDPGETRDLLAASPAVARALATRLEERMHENDRRYKSVEASEAPAPAKAPDDDEVERLRGLGYAPLPEHEASP
ncbi:MAG: sulfatase [Acidobacteriota bacterium]